VKNSSTELAEDSCE